jgi:hypothetical protein
MNANELADKLMSSLTMEYDCDVYMEQAATMLRQQQAKIEALKKQILDWENINKPNPFIGWEKNLVAVDPNPNSGLGGVALRKAQEKC